MTPADAVAPDVDDERSGGGGDDGSGEILISDPHVIKAIEYCQAILAGEIPSCDLARRACQRQLNDLERWATDPSYPFEFDEYRAGRVCRFIEQFPHVKGPKANAHERIKLEPWQCFGLTTMYGWIEKKTQKRRFRRAYWEVGRGNAKSTILAGLGLYAASADGEQGAEVVSAATKRDQARIVFGTAQDMLRKRPDLAKRLGLRDSAHAIVHSKSHSSFRPLSREAKREDGANIHFACVDELHAHPTRYMYDVLETALGKRDQSMLVVITTAGSNTSGICYEIRTYCRQVLEGTVQDDAQFAVIYTIDEDAGDDWLDETSWKKANPNWGVSVMPDVIAGLAKKARAIASAQNNFKTKHLNVWCSADTSWVNLLALDACADPTLKLSDFEQNDVWIGFDLASVSDLAARAKVFIRDVPDAHDPSRMERHYYLFASCYLPEDTIKDSPNASYSGWAREGLIVTTPGAVLDFRKLEQDTLDDSARFRIVEAPFDPWQALKFAGDLLEHGVNMIEFRQTTLHLSAAMKELESAILGRRFHYDGNSCVRWQFSNVVAHRDGKDNIVPKKQRDENKIDAVVATIMAIGRAMLHSDPYADRGFRTL